MALISAEAYLDSIRARKLRVFYRGQQIDNIVDHPIARAAARCVAEVYRAAQDPDTAALMTKHSELVDEPVNVSNILWRTPEDLITRIKWERHIGRITGRGALRSPGLDAMNALAITTWDTKYHQRVHRLRRARAARRSGGIGRDDGRARRSFAATATTDRSRHVSARRRPKRRRHCSARCQGASDQRGALPRACGVADALRRR